MESVFRPVNVEAEPSISLSQWSIYRCFFDENNSDFSDHIVGQAEGYGRVSSKIIFSDPGRKLAVTKSGRCYCLDPEYAGNMSSDASYVFNIWKRRNKVINDVNITDQWILSA